MGKNTTEHLKENLNVVDNIKSNVKNDENVTRNGFSQLAAMKNLGGPNRTMEPSQSEPAGHKKPIRTDGTWGHLLIQENQIVRDKLREFALINSILSTNKIKLPEDGRLEPVDWKWLLYSRYGITINPDQCESLRTVGGPKWDPYMDLVKLLSLTLTPELLKDAANLSADDFKSYSRHVDDIQTIIADQESVEESVKLVFRVMTKGTNVLRKQDFIDLLDYMAEDEIAEDYDLVCRMWDYALGEKNSSKKVAPITTTIRSTSPTSKPKLLPPPAQVQSQLQSPTQATQTTQTIPSITYESGTDEDPMNAVKPVDDLTETSSVKEEQLTREDVKAIQEKTFREQMGKNIKRNRADAKLDKRTISYQQFRDVLRQGFTWSTTSDIAPTSIIEDTYGYDTSEMKATPAPKRDDKPPSYFIDHDPVRELDYLQNTFQDHQEVDLTEIKVKKSSIHGSIDWITDEMMSPYYMWVVLFVFVLSALIYIIPFVSYISTKDACVDSNSWCGIGWTVALWLIIAVFSSILGILYIIPLSLCNASYATRYGCIASILWHCLQVGISVYFVIATRGLTSQDPAVQKILKTMNSVYIEILAIMLVVGDGLAFLYQFYFLYRTLRPSDIVLPYWKYISTDLKYAAHYKMLSIIKEVVKLSKTETSGRIQSKMFSDSAISELGYFEIYRRVLNSRLAKEEGLYIAMRVQFLILAQFVSLIIYVMVGVVLSVEASNECNRLRDQYANSALLYVIPESWMVLASMIPGFSIGLLVMISIIFFTIPNYVWTVLNYRTGHRRLIGYPTGQALYRGFIETIGYIVGMGLWMSASAGFVIFLIIAGVLFVCVWPPTRSLAVWLWGIVIGSTITTIIFMIGATVTRALSTEVYMRERRLYFSLNDVALVSWIIATGTSSALTRLGMLALAFVLFLGRIDTPILEDSLKSLDSYPNMYEKFLLTREAHMHPYINRVAQLLMQYIAKPQLHSEEADCWRLIYTVVLLPSTRNFRIHKRDVLEETLEKEKLATESAAADMADGEKQSWLCC